MYLNVASTAKLPSKTADDIEGTLYKFIPPGIYFDHMINVPGSCFSDYSKSIEAFQATVEKDAATFKPLGEKIHSYTRRAAGRGKGKSKETSSVEEDDSNAVVYEVYHVSDYCKTILLLSPSSRF
jgi:histone acetyltransferase 1